MIESALTGGGTAGIIIAVAYAYQQWKASRREDQAEPREARTSAVTDAATANSLLLASLKEEREEVQRLSGEVAELRTQNAALYQRMREQRRDYEHEIAELREQVDLFRQQLDNLQQRLSTDDPPPSPLR